MAATIPEKQPRLLDQLRRCIQNKRDSFSTELILAPCTDPQNAPALVEVCWISMSVNRPSSSLRLRSANSSPALRDCASDVKARLCAKQKLALPRASNVSVANSKGQANHPMQIKQPVITTRFMHRIGSQLNISMMIVASST